MGDMTAPEQTTGEAAARARAPIAATLPPPTMTSEQIRRALWDIAARQRAGQAAKALDDYADRFQATRTLESRFLAAAAIPNLGAQWDALHQIATDQPKFYWAHAQMAEIYAHWRVRDWGEKELSYAYACDPRNPYTYTVRGDLYRHLGDLGLAVRSYQIALGADPRDPDAEVGLALAQEATGSDPDYEAQLGQALQDLPTEYDAALALAELYDQQNRSAQAKAAWERVAQLAPGNRAAKLALARLAGNASPNDAITAYEEAAKLKPLDKNEEGTLAKLYRQVGDTASEVKSLERLTKLDPKNVAPWRRLAEIAAQKGSLPEMETYNRSILALSPNDAQAFRGLATVAERRGKLEEALNLYRKALAGGDTAAQADLDRIRQSCLVPAKAISGYSLTSVYRKASDALVKIYNQRLTVAPALKGSVAAKVHLSREGKALTVDIVENTTNDPYIEANLAEVLHDAAWPRLKARDHDTFTLTFNLPPVTRLGF